MVTLGAIPHSQSLAGPFAASFVPVAHFYALLALPNVCGTYRVPKQSKMATTWANHTHCSWCQGTTAKPHFGPTFHPFGVPKPLTSEAF